MDIQTYSLIVLVFVDAQLSSVVQYHSGSFFAPNNLWLLEGWKIHMYDVFTHSHTYVRTVRARLGGREWLFLGIL